MYKEEGREMTQLFLFFPFRTLLQIQCVRCHLMLDKTSYWSIYVMIQYSKNSANCYAYQKFCIMVVEVATFIFDIFIYIYHSVIFSTTVRRNRISIVWIVRKNTKKYVCPISKKTKGASFLCTQHNDGTYSSGIVPWQRPVPIWGKSDFFRDGTT